MTVAAEVLKYGGNIAVLTHLLTPGDFGLVAMVAAVVGFLATFKDAGLSAATIQRENVSREQVRTLFGVNVVAVFRAPRSRRSDPRHLLPGLPIADAAAAHGERANQRCRMPALSRLQSDSERLRS